MATRCVEASNSSNIRVDWRIVIMTTTAYIYFHRLININGNIQLQLRKEDANLYYHRMLEAYPSYKDKFDNAYKTALDQTRKKRDLEPERNHPYAFTKTFEYYFCKELRRLFSDQAQYIQQCSSLLFHKITPGTVERLLQEYGIPLSNLLEENKISLTSLLKHNDFPQVVWPKTPLTFEQIDQFFVENGIPLAQVHISSLGALLKTEANLRSREQIAQFFAVKPPDQRAATRPVVRDLSRRESNLRTTGF